jgi:F-type H+-transporting ATPase subunit b
MTMPFEVTSLLHQVPVYLLQAHAEAEPAGLWDRILHSNLLNVVLVLLILGYFIKKQNLLSGIDSQQSKIANEVQILENQKKEALAQLEDVKNRTANLKSEVDEILKNARQSAEALSTQILTAAQTESAKIVDNAKKRVELEQRAAIKGLEDRLLNDALSDAREEMARSLSATEQKRSVETFLEELSHLKGGR